MHCILLLYQDFRLPGQEQPLYPRLLHEIVESGVDNMNFDCQHLESLSPQLYSELRLYPQEIIPVFDLALVGGASALYDIFWVPRTHSAHAHLTINQ
jgi:hypothetical protein